eukprot:gnl/Dysnectes_brevis/6541_a10233_312.p1 GENE.gnl/Dysnectes_brevis/6541_a10233_312~~gnl/Dysnectes_brevis/6541_a10233_312.p1  ORF type:complete len:292 (-),score=19.19 gnl/Dysnectes_brevis/6541_a10233_312:101-976(-)
MVEVLWSVSNFMILIQLFSGITLLIFCLSRQPMIKRSLFFSSLTAQSAFGSVQVFCWFFTRAIPDWFCNLFIAWIDLWCFYACKISLIGISHSILTVVMHCNPAHGISMVTSRRMSTLRVRYFIFELSLPTVITITGIAVQALKPGTCWWDLTNQHQALMMLIFFYCFQFSNFCALTYIVLKVIFKVRKFKRVYAMRKLLDDKRSPLSDSTSRGSRSTEQQLTEVVRRCWWIPLVILMTLSTTLMYDLLTYLGKDQSYFFQHILGVVSFICASENLFVMLIVMVPFFVGKL